jgi:hypothetical protein
MLYKDGFWSPIFIEPVCRTLRETTYCRRQLRGCVLQRHFTLATCLSALQGLSWSFDGIAQLPGVCE